MFLCKKKSNKYKKLYYYCTSEEQEYHGDFELKPGLNILDKKTLKRYGPITFNDLSEISSIDFDFYTHHNWIRIIEIPEGTHVKQGNTFMRNNIKTTVNTPNADKVILREKYPIYDLDTLNKFRLRPGYDFYSRAKKILDKTSYEKLMTYKAPEYCRFEYF